MPRIYRISEVNLSRYTYEKGENSGPILTDFPCQGDTKAISRIRIPRGGAMVIFIYEETTMKRDPPPQLDKPRSNLLGFPQVEFSWSACSGRVGT